MKLIYSKDSVKDLKRLREFIAINNPQAAAKIASKLIKSINTLINNPELGMPVLQAADPDSIRDIYILNYHIRYLISSNAIYILRIWH
jgi:plasmid stabilization system protein ParE